jgi:hypothetical protein
VVIADRRRGQLVWPYPAKTDAWRPIGAVGALDTFLVDKMLNGWRPHTFVQSELLPFVSPPNR